VLRIIFYNKHFLCQIHEYLGKKKIAIGIKRSIEELRSRLRFYSDHNKFKFQNGLSYHDGKNAFNGLIQHKILQAKHNVLTTCNLVLTRPWT